MMMVWLLLCCNIILLFPASCDREPVGHSRRGHMLRLPISAVGSCAACDEAVPASGINWPSDWPSAMRAAERHKPAVARPAASSVPALCYLALIRFWP